MLETLHEEGWRDFRPIDGLNPVGRTDRGLPQVNHLSPSLILEIRAEKGGSARKFLKPCPELIDPWPRPDLAACYLREAVRENPESVAAKTLYAEAESLLART